MLPLPAVRMAVAALVLIALLGRASPLQGQQAFKRYEARTPQGQAMLKSYAKAVAKMKATPEGQPRAWQFQWYTHWVNGDTSKAAEIKRIYSTPSSDRELAQLMWSTCQPHGQGMNHDNFLPWHRAYVYYFERIVREISGDSQFTLPYWDYSAAGTNHAVLPEEFRKANDPIFGPLFVKGRKPGVNDGDPIDKHQPGALDLDVLEECHFGVQNGSQGFTRLLDAGVHGAVHVGVGDVNNMGSVPFAANDPIFWLHHCNIDRLWASWNAGGRQNPSLSAAFVFVDEQGKKVEAKLNDFMDIAALKYEYDRLETVPSCPPPVVVGSALPPKKVAAMTQKQVRLGANAVRVPLQVTAPPTGKPLPLTAVVAGLPKGKKLILAVRNLQAKTQPGVAYNLYLDLPAADGEKAKHRVGSINFFSAVRHEAPGGHDMGSADDPGPAFQFDITELARRLHAANLLTESPVLTIAPAGTPAATAEPAIGEITILQK